MIFLPYILDNVYNTGIKNNDEIGQYNYLSKQCFGNVKKTRETHINDVILNAYQI